MKKGPAQARRGHAPWLNITPSRVAANSRLQAEEGELASDPLTVRSGTAWPRCGQGQDR